MKFSLRVACPVIFLLPLVACLPLLAETDPEVASYSIPADAVKVESSTPYGVELGVPAWWENRVISPSTDNSPHADSKEGTRFFGAASYRYYPAGVEQNEANMVAEDTFCEGVRVRRELLKNGHLYGIQRDWYLDGHLKSEQPFKNDVLDGIVKHWNIWGQLVGQYEMKAGSGVRRMYYDNGQLQAMDELKDNRLNGWMVLFFPNGQVQFLGCFKDNQPQGIGFEFDGRGELSNIDFANGPYVYFDSSKDLQFVQWRLYGQDVSAAEYAASCGKDPSLPPYYTDIDRYRSFYSSEVKTRIARYRAIPRVLIPLLLDEKGRPFPAGIAGPVNAVRKWETP